MRYSIARVEQAEFFLLKFLRVGTEFEGLNRENMRKAREKFLTRFWDYLMSEERRTHGGIYGRNHGGERIREAVSAKKVGLYLIITHEQKAIKTEDFSLVVLRDCFVLMRT